MVLQGSRLTSLADHQVTLHQLEANPPEIRGNHDNTTVERWTFSVEVLQFPTTTVDTVKRGEALANFEREFIIHFRTISKAADVYAKAVKLWKSIGDVPVTQDYDWTKLLNP